ncbi:protein MTSS 1-like isoform X4 [Lissotriton helveticus]
MDAGMEKECSALGGLFQTIISDMKSSYPTWEDFISKTIKLQSQLRTTTMVTGSFLDAFQKIADMAINTRGATKEIGSALTRMCMRHRNIESRLKQLTVALADNLINPLEIKIEEWKKVANQLDKDHAKDYKKARAEIKKKSSDTIKLQKKVRKGKDDARMQLDTVLQDVNDKYVVLEETEKKAVHRALIEERGRFCSFVLLLRPVLDEEIGMLGEITHLQTLLEDLTNLTSEPNKLPPMSEQVINDLKSSDYNFIYQTPPSSPSGTLSRKASTSSNYQHTSMRHVPSMDSISSSLEGLHMKSSSSSITDSIYQTKFARDHLALVLNQGLSTEIQHSRDSLHCSSGYSTQTTTPSCSEDTIPSHVSEYDYISLHGEQEDPDQLDFDKSSTIPRNSDISQNYRRMFQTKRPASTVSLLADPEPIVRSPYVATIRRKPSGKPVFRRGTISGMPIPIRTPVVPVGGPNYAELTAGLFGGRTNSEEFVNAQDVRADLPHVKHGIYTSAQSLNAIQSPYCAFVPNPSYNYPMHTNPSPTSPQKISLNPSVKMAAVNSIIESRPLPQTATAVHFQRMPSTDGSLESEGLQSDFLTPNETNMLTMIRRGVKLRKTISNDRSAPQIK